MTKPRFLVDAMLGKTARRIRILGYDAAYMADANGNRVLREAISSGRTIITASATLYGKAQKAGISSILTPAHPPDLTMHHIIRASGISAKIDTDTARCALCNGETIPVDTRPGGIKAGTVAHIKKFRRCEMCGHIYWKGSHIQNLQKEGSKWT